MSRPPKKSGRKRVFCPLCGGITGFQKGTIKKAECPCAHCGQLPSAFIKQRRAFFHFLIAVGSSTLVAVGLVCTCLDLASITTWTRVAGISGLVGLLGHIGVAAWDPNSSASKNRDRKESMISDSVITAAGMTEPDLAAESSWGLRWNRVALISGAALAVCLMVLPQAYANIKGWVHNDEFGILGPGDTFEVAYENTLRSINGNWRGGTSAKVIFDEDDTGVSLDGLKGAPPKGDWGNTIFSGTTKPFAPVASLTLPEDQSLSWRKVKLKVGLGVSYPIPMGHEQFDVRTTSYNKVINVVLSAPNAGATLSAMWNFCAAIGALLFVLTGFSLAASPEQTNRPSVE